MPEIAKALKRSRSSVENSMETLAKAGYVKVTSYGRGVPPSITVAGYTVMLMEDVPDFT